MKRRITLFVFSSFLFTSLLFAQSSLRIIDPNQWIGDEGNPGTIEEAEFQIEAKGLYMEVGIFLTLSEEGIGYSLQDTLEIVLDFNLPPGAIVHDSWLWMNDSLIVKADVYDISEATEIYEDIVDRNRDPSLLYRKNNGGYQLRVFPLAGTESRKVKITYLTPAIWSKNTVESWLPLELLQSTNIPLADIRIVSIADSLWGQPSLVGVEDIEFESFDDPIVGQLWVATVPESEFGKPIRFAMESPMNEEGFFVRTLEEANGENIFQLAYMPPELTAPSDPKKIAVLFDHEPANAIMDKSAVFDFVKDKIKGTLTAEDHINLFYSNFSQTEMAANAWVPCDSNSLMQLFSTLDDPIGNGSNLVDALTTTIEFVKQNGGDGEILLFSNSSDWVSSNQTQLWLDLIGDDEITIHVVNYQTLNYYWNHVWNGSDILEYNHKTLYERITSLTGGNFFSGLGEGMNAWEAIETAIVSFKNAGYIFDLDIDSSTGFTYETFFQTYLGQSSNINQPILQVGKYVGDFPSTLDFTGYHDGNFIFDSKTIQPSDVIQEDTLLREIWIGHLIRSLEGSANNSAEIQEIVTISKAERVLSKYTAFLALELALGGEPCLYCWNFDNIIVESTEEVFDYNFDIAMTASPNPFSDYCDLNIEIIGDERPDQLIVQIFDSFGKLVKVIDARRPLVSGNFQFTWDGRSATGQKLSPGIYHLIVQTEKGIEAVKLALIR